MIIEIDTAPLLRIFVQGEKIDVKIQNFLVDITKAL